jgi:uroporphyrinogen decarboxylase
MPWFKQFTLQGRSHNLQVILHSCGSVFEVIEDMIESGVQCLHPLQALAANMDAEILANNFKGRITFLGGIDTQNLLSNGTPQMVRQEVRRVKRLLGPNLIISPSHEAILPDVPAENIEALALEAIQD